MLNVLGCLETIVKPVHDSLHTAVKPSPDCQQREITNEIRAPKPN